MKLYNDGKEVLVDKSQMNILLEAGWTTSPDSEPITSTSEEIEEVDEVEEVKVTKPKKTIKTKKISLKD